VEHNSDKEQVVYVGERRKKKADTAEAVNMTPFIVIIIICIIALAVSIFLGYRDHRSNREKISFFEKQAHMVVDKLERMNTANVYRDHLKLDRIKITRSADSVKVSGLILNTGSLPISDIGITLYFLDGQGRIVSHESYLSVPPNGTPLQSNSTRSFDLSLPVSEDTPAMIRPVITEITTIDTENH